MKKIFRKIIYVIVISILSSVRIIYYFLAGAKFCATSIKFLCKKMRKRDKKPVRDFASTYKDDKGDIAPNKER